MLDSIVDSTTYFLAHYTTHRTANESEIHTANDNRRPLRVAHRCTNGIFEPRFVSGFF